MDYAERKHILQTVLKESRFLHSLGVAETASFLADRFGQNREKARLAGLLHDCGRQFPNGVLCKEAEQRGISYGCIEAANPLLLHGAVGSRLLSEKYEVYDKDIAQAVWRHTVGGKDMTVLDKIIYFADMIEPSRVYPGVDELRRLSEEATLDDMLLEGFNRSINFVVARNLPIHPDTVIARNEIILKEQ